MADDKLTILIVEDDLDVADMLIITNYDPFKSVDALKTKLLK